MDRLHQRLVRLRRPTESNVRKFKNVFGEEGGGFEDLVKVGANEVFFFG